MLHVRTGRPVGIFPLACLPALSGHQPGRKWLHEIKHDGFRIMARRDDNGVRLYTRNGYDFACQFPQIVEAACPNLRCAPASSTARPSWSMSVVFQPLTCCAPGGMTMWRLPPYMSPTIQMASTIIADLPTASPPAGAYTTPRSRPTERCDLKGSGAACVRFIAATPRSAAPAADDLCARVLAATPARSRLKFFTVIARRTLHSRRTGCSRSRIRYCCSGTWGIR